jgi:tetratricopeptide (TPR) repeat protein
MSACFGGLCVIHFGSPCGALYITQPNEKQQTPDGKTGCKFLELCDNTGVDLKPLAEDTKMKLLTSLIFTIALVAPMLAQTPSGTEAQVKQELNEAARAYREGNFPEAQVHSERALLLDPENKAAPYYLARTIQAQYKPGDFTPENVAKAREAITAYQRIVERSHADDEAYKAVGYLYGALKEEELLREWILQRAGNTSLPNDKRAEAYIILASKDWDCSYRITELPTNKPKRAEFEQAKECANRALGLANMAVALAPENTSGWSYKTNILVELEKLAEMEGDVQQKTEFHRQYEEALQETTRLTKSSQPKP